MSKIMFVKDLYNRNVKFKTLQKLSNDLQYFKGNNQEKTECFNMKFYYYKNKKQKGMFIILISEHLIYSTRDLNFTMLTCFMKNLNHLTTNMQLTNYLILTENIGKIYMKAR